jgi:hypothetical protein
LIAFPDGLIYLAVGYASAGLIGFMAPGFLFSENEFAVPRLPMFSLTLLLVAGALLVRNLEDGLIFRWIAAFLALSACAFSRPGAGEVALPYLPFEIVLVPVALALGVAGVVHPDSPATRLALVSCPAMLTIIYALGILVDRTGLTSSALFAVAWAAATMTVFTSSAAAWGSNRRRRTA